MTIGIDPKGLYYRLKLPFKIGKCFTIGEESENLGRVHTIICSIKELDDLIKYILTDSYILESIEEV